MIEVDVSDFLARDVEEDIMRRIEAGALNGLRALAMMTQSEAQRRILQGPKSGRVYPRGRYYHRASAPGEAPANDTGFLASSLRIDVTDRREVDLRALAPYAVHLEYGTRNMKPRPFLRVSAARVAEHRADVMAAAVDAELRR